MQRRILLAILGLIITLIGLFYIINAFIVQRSFREYNEIHAKAHVELIPSILTLYYANYGQWHGVEFELVQLSVLAGTQVTIVDERGEVVTSTADDVIGEPFDTGQAFTKVFDIQAQDGTLAGTAYVRLLPAAQTVDQSLSSSLNQGLLISVGMAVLVGSLIAALLARSISKPILTIEQAAQKIAAGEYDTRLKPLESRDEVARLAATFNVMSDRLQQTERLRRKLVADVSHDLRTPLTVIKGYLEGLIQGKIKDRSTAELIFGRIDREVSYLQELVDTLSTAAKWDSGEITPERQPTDPHTLVAQVIDRFAWAADHRHGELINCVPPDLPTIDLDRKMVSQAIYNLIDNALRHNSNPITIEVAACVQDQTLTLSVTDDGVGIAPSEHEHIFERFVRLDADRGRDRSGVGMGLSIVRSVALAHGGRAWVESNEPHGARFMLRLGPS